MTGHSLPRWLLCNHLDTHTVYTDTWEACIQLLPHAADGQATHKTTFPTSERFHFASVRLPLSMAPAS